MNSAIFRAAPNTESTHVQSISTPRPKSRGNHPTQMLLLWAGSVCGRILSERNSARSVPPALCGSGLHETTPSAAVKSGLWNVSKDHNFRRSRDHMWPPPTPAIMSGAYFTPQISRQPATVDYIDNQLPKHHAMFANPPLRFDVVSEQFVPKPQHMMPEKPEVGAVVLSDDSDDALNYYGIPPRPAHTNLNAMELWKRTMPQALAKFRETSAPEGRDAAYSIRDKDDWDAIYDTLESAQKKYTSDEGKSGTVRRLRRKMADKAGVLGEMPKTVSKIVPSNPYSTPVLCAVELIFDVCRNSSSILRMIY